MYRGQWFTLFGGFFIVLAAGCASGEPEATQPDIVPDKGLTEFVDEISLKELLTKPRAELAQLAEDCQAKINFLEEKHRVWTLQFRRLPDLRLPLATSVFREAKYSAKLGFSVPPYLPEDVTDSGLALHLARFGDVEAARKLVDPGDADTRRRIEGLAGPINYPVEWTRLVALLLHNAQVQLVTEEQYKATRLVALHKQLAEVLDPQAKASPLGTALLPRGHVILKQLAASWRAKDLPELADPAEVGLKAWGDFPTPVLPLQPGKSNRDEVARLFGVSPTKSSRVLQPDSIQRALDLLALPLPCSDVENVIACFDPSGTFNDLLVIMRPRLAERIPQPGQLAHLLEEATAPEKVKSIVQDGLTYRRYTLPGSVCEVALTPHNAAVGGIVRFHEGRLPLVTTLPRELGKVCLDHTFEKNRRHAAVNHVGSQLVLEDTEELAHFPNPAGKLRLQQAVLYRAEHHDLLARLTLHWTGQQKGLRTLGKLAFPLCNLVGSPHIEAVGSPHEGHLAVSWKDQRTCWTLRLPNKVADGPQLEIADLTPTDQVNQRAILLRQQELEERQKRLEAGKPEQRLERDIEGLTLGNTRGEVDSRYPANQETIVVGQAVTLAIRFARPATREFLWQELVARFNTEQKLVEIRFRFRDAKGKNGSAAKKLEELKQKYGAPHVDTGSWQGVWSAPGKAVLYRWQDDWTLLTWQQDSSGVELTVRDCPAAHPDGLPLEPLALLDRGPVGCRLGDRQAEVLARFKGQKPAQLGGPWILTPRKNSPYDALLVWFKGDKVVRVLGRHDLDPTQVVGKEAAKLVVQVWNSNLAQYGWPRRQEINAGLLESRGNHDDRTRVRVFWRKDQGGGSLFTEWSDLTP